MGPELLQISSTSTFTMLEARVDERFQGDQTIFDDLRQAPIMVDAVEVHIYDGDEEKGATMEYKCSQVLPFDNKATATGFWSIIGADSSMHQKQIVKRSENTSAADSRCLLRFPVGRDGILIADTLSVMKRFLTAQAALC
ncbi:unnamed protein product [Phytophthora lilii]|uniref:Unnamed protein product n=1 Tax=Phytophthora lilii TaxID=2077276 RepID=A0A9W6U8I2_9STRA|nr:unnamed protein product [Phytophthora lilii]